MTSNYIALPKRAIDVTGKKFNRLTALGPTGQDRQNQMVWLCRCDCGNLTFVSSSNLRIGHTKSCGCLHGEVLSERSVIHNMSGTKIYATWTHLIQRCINPSDAAYDRYGGRGISVCAEWRFSFEDFYACVSGLSHFNERGYTLDRINNDGDYEPSNIRWSTQTEQARNKRNSRYFTYGGKTQTATEWGEQFGLEYKTLLARLNRGWDMERALRTPVWRGRWKQALS